MAGKEDRDNPRKRLKMKTTNSFPPQYIISHYFLRLPSIPLSNSSTNQPFIIYVPNPPSGSSFQPAFNTHYKGNHLDRHCSKTAHHAVCKEWWPQLSFSDNVATHHDKSRHTNLKLPTQARTKSERNSFDSYPRRWIKWGLLLKILEGSSETYCRYRAWSGRLRGG